MSDLDDLRSKVLSPTPEPGFEFVEIVVDADGHVLGKTDATFEEYTARGRVSDCTCRLIQCVCTRSRGHKDDCTYRMALTCPISVPCEEHGYDVCPHCDLCTCKGQPGC